MLRSLILRTFVTNSGITILGLANSVLLARWLGPIGRGEVAAAMLWPTLLVYISSVGLIVAAVYFAALPDSRPPLILGNSIVMGLLLSALFMPIGYLVLPWLLRSQSWAVVNGSRIYLGLIPLSLVAQFGIGVLQGRLKMIEVNWLRTILPFGYLLGTVALMASGRLTLINILILHLLLNGAILVLALVCLARYEIRPVFKPNVALAKAMLRYGSKVHVGNISGLANLSLDQVLMAAWLPASYLGLYVVAVSAAGLSQMFAQAVQTVVTPSIAQRESATERGALLQTVFRPYWLCSLVITIAIALVLPVLIPLVFGNNFKTAIWPAEVLLVGSFFVGAKQVLAGGAQALGNPWLSSKANLVALVVTLALLYALLRRFGILGAAIASTAAYLAELMVVIYGLRRSHAISPMSLIRIKLGDLTAVYSMIGIVAGPKPVLDKS